MFTACHKEILMTISVIIPYYNPDANRQTDELLIRAILSARDNLEGVTDYEIIVVNDGSPSDPALPADDHIRYITRPHGMLGAARNTGMDNATGLFISFLDADDLYLPGTLAPCIKAISESGADLLGFGIKRINQDRCNPETPAGTPRFQTPVKGDEYMRTHNLPGSACRYLIRASLLSEHKLRFMENAYIEDEEFTPRLMYHSQSYIETSYPVYAYCIRGGSIITSSSDRMIQARSADTIKALDHLLSFSSTLGSAPHPGLDRKISYLAMDHIRRTLRRKDWRTSSRDQISTLQSMGLFPLRCKESSPGFKLYSLLSRCDAGRLLLRLADKIYR